MMSTKTVTVKNLDTNKVIAFDSKALKAGKAINNVLTILDNVADKNLDIEIKTSHGRVISHMVKGVEMVKQVKHRAPKVAAPAVAPAEIPATPEA